MPVLPAWGKAGESWTLTWLPRADVGFMSSHADGAEQNLVCGAPWYKERTGCMLATRSHWISCAAPLLAESDDTRQL